MLYALSVLQQNNELDGMKLEEKRTTLRVVTICYY